MAPWTRSSGIKLCKRCGFELEGGEEICPSCRFAPKSHGLKLSGYVLLAVPVMWIVGILLLGTYPSISSTLMVLSLLVFFVSAAMYVVSMLARPYRFSGIFLRLR